MINKRHSFIVSVFSGYIRPVLEYCWPVFNGSLTKKQENQLEMIQKRACRIILGRNYTSYSGALETCHLRTLTDRRKQLCLDFARSVVKNPLVSDWIPVNQQNHEYTLRSNTSCKYKQFKCKTNMFQDSAIPYLIQLLNSNN